MKRWRINKQTAAGAGILIVILLCMLFAELLAPHDPVKNNLEVRYAPATLEYPMGTDAYGRCIFSRLIFGARYSFGLALFIMAVIALIALPLSMAAAYLGGIAEKVLLWVSDISMALPPTVLLLSIIGVLGQGTGNLIFGAVFSYLGWYMRMVRSYTLVEKSKGYVVLALTGGTPHRRILTRHILPNILPGLLVLFALGVGDVILMISGFSFLGIALPSGTPEWGAMLNEARGIFLKDPQYAVYPGICVFLAVCGCNLVGEGLRGRLSPYGKAVDNER